MLTKTNFQYDLCVCQFHIYFPCLGALLSECLNSVLNVEALVAVINHEKALEGAFSVIVKYLRTIVLSSNV